ncbi:MAG TPA: response regulator transcription factor [Synergistales bacterium]|nr:response regulator transcription factor [Synergistales bacterium]
MTHTYRVVLAEDHKLFRDGLERLLSLEEDIEVVGTADNGQEAIRVVEEAKPEILLLDVHMPVMGGAEMVRILREKGMDMKYIAITAFDDEGHIAELSEAGVNGYILKASGFDQVQAAIRSVGKGFPYVDPAIAQKLLSPMKKNKGEEDLLERLSIREKEALYWLAQGFNNQEIAEKMILSDKTVKNHLSHLMKKLNIQDRTQAAIIAWKTGLAKEDPAQFQIDIV